MNILTFDIEEWFLEKKNHGGREFRYQQFDDYLAQVLDLLDEVGTKATFFCLGKVASGFPTVVRKIAERGHEIGCHSDEHLWLNTLTPDQLRKDTHDAISSLEDIIGKNVLSYRAPAFTIGEKNKWAIEILAENGITRDASIYPALRDFGGFSTFSAKKPAIIEYNGIQIKEFPVSITTLLGKDITYSGGGYFRFLPYGYVKKIFNQREYSIAYFHLGDIIKNPNGMMSKDEHEKYYKEPGSMKNRMVRYVKSSLGTAKAFGKMEKLIRNFDFINVEKADGLIDWGSTQVISL